VVGGGDKDEGEWCGRGQVGPGGKKGMSERGRAGVGRVKWRVRAVCRALPCHARLS
jgi:hypothetical protein